MAADSDYTVRDIGAASVQAVEAVELAVWKRSSETIARAEKLYGDLELTPDLAYGLMIALIEQKRLLGGLRTQAETGLRAARRIQGRVEHETAVVLEEARQETRGKNRFHRSRAKS